MHWHCLQMKENFLALELNVDDDSQIMPNSFAVLDAIVFGYSMTSTKQFSPNNQKACRYQCRVRFRLKSKSLHDYSFVISISSGFVKGERRSKKKHESTTCWWTLYSSVACVPVILKWGGTRFVSFIDEVVFPHFFKQQTWHFIRFEETKNSFVKLIAALTASSCILFGFLKASREWN